MNNWILALREYTEVQNLYNTSLLKAFDGSLIDTKCKAIFPEAANSLRL